MHADGFDSDDLVVGQAHDSIEEGGHMPWFVKLTG